eukprot:659589-Hanusia_phi.AAC.1
MSTPGPPFPSNGKGVCEWGGGCDGNLSELERVCVGAAGDPSTPPLPVWRLAVTAADSSSDDHLGFTSDGPGYRSVPVSF